MSIGYILNKAFFESRWVCAYRILNDEDRRTGIVPEKGEIRSYHVIEAPHRYWMADPFVVENGSETHLFFEYMDRYKAKAVLGQMLLAPKIGTPRSVFEFLCHTSYPCVIKEGSEFYIIPETVAQKKLELLHCRRWPDQWEAMGTLLDDTEVVDCTPFRRNDRWYIFLYEISHAEKKRVLKIGELNIAECRIDHLKPVMEYDIQNGRPGGNVYRDGSRLIRAVQIGKRHYGEQLEFYDFEYDGENYAEKKIGEMTPEQISLDNGMHVDGVHTINRAGNIEVIDVLINHEFHLFRPVMLILQILGIGKFDLGDKRQRMINKY